MEKQLKYAYLDAHPVVFNETEAWAYMGGRWQKLHLAEAHGKAKLLTKAEFDDMFRQIPSLPSSAFH